MRTLTLFAALAIVPGVTHAQSNRPAADSAINRVLDNWHQAAATADADAYFGAMDSNAVFLGTDPGERWVKSAFRAWAKPYFDRKKAWDFHPHDRHISYSSDGRIAWFDELLDTWMGPCRGSGVLVKTGKGWLIEQYNLAMLVPNAKINDVIKLLGGAGGGSNEE
jgi:SnoaL-like domain